MNEMVSDLNLSVRENEDQADRYRRSAKRIIYDKRVSGQKYFEGEMQTGLCLDNLAEGNPDLDMEIDFRMGLEILAKRHYGNVDNPSNPSGRREAEIIISIFYERKTQVELAKEYGVTNKRIWQIKNRGLRHLREIMVGYD